MATNGYDSLTSGPEAGWLGHYSLSKQGKLEDWPQLAPLPIEPEDDELGNEEHKVTTCLSVQI